MSMIREILWAVLFTAGTTTMIVSLVRAVRDRCAVIYIDAAAPQEEVEEAVRNSQRTGFVAWVKRSHGSWWLLVVIGVSMTVMEALDLWLGVLETLAATA